jgi:hypothetical protein
MIQLIGLLMIVTGCVALYLMREKKVRCSQCGRRGEMAPRQDWGVCVECQDEMWAQVER